MKKYDYDKGEGLICNKIVFIGSPYRGDVKKNVYNAIKYSRFAIQNLCMPVTPHLMYPHMLNDNIEEERKLGLLYGQILLEKCDEIWVFGKVSEGMAVEMLVAQKAGIPIRFFNENCEEVTVPCGL